MDDKYVELQKIFTKEIEEVKNSNHEELIAICEKENVEYEGLTDDEIRQYLIEYYEDEIED